MQTAGLFVLLLVAAFVMVSPIVLIFLWKFGKWRTIQREEWRKVAEGLGGEFEDTTSRGLSFCALIAEVDGYQIEADISQGIPVGDNMSNLGQVSEWRTVVLARHKGKADYYMSERAFMSKNKEWFADSALNKKFETISEGELPEFPVELEPWLKKQHGRSWIIGSNGMITLAMPQPAPNADDLHMMIKVAVALSKLAEASE